MKSCSKVKAIALILFLMVACKQPPESRTTPADNGELQAEKQKNVLIITIDTLRADHLSCYGYPRPTSPVLDKLSKSGLLSVSMICTAPYTVPSHASLFTGLYPWHHDCRSNYTRLNPATTTLVKLLKDKGYSTAAFISGSPLTASVCGLNVGFDVYDDSMTREVFKQTKVLIAESQSSGSDGSRHRKPQTGGVKVKYARRDGKDTVQTAISWLKNAESPWFLWVHLYDVHGPYEPSSPISKIYTDDIWDPISKDLKGVWIPDYQQRSDAKPADYISDYDSLIYYDDKLVEKLVIYLKNNKMDKSTLTCVLSDHGKYLYQPCLQIPFILICKDDVPVNRLHDGLLSEIDIFPTIWKLMFKQDLSNHIKVPGFTDFIFGKGSLLDPVVRYAETKPNHSQEPSYRLFCVTDGEWKYVYSVDQQRSEIYNLDTDPEELHSSADDLNSETAKSMRSLIELEVKPGEPVNIIQKISAQEKAVLKSLGYIDGK